MKKLNVAIIGQGRSGRNIHGKYFLSDDNTLYNVKYVVETDARRREMAEETFAGCKTFATYQELFDIKDIDLVVNASYSQMHYPITLDLIEHGFNVLVEKPFGRTKLECETLMLTAEKKGVVLAVFQQTFLAPFYIYAKELLTNGKIGEVKEVTIRYNGFARRWDWQTLLKNCAGSLYNTGPHPVGMGLGFLDFDENTKVAYSKLDRALTSGDADDFAKVILTAPGKPVVDIEISSMDAYTPFNLHIQGTRGTFKCTSTEYEMTYIVEGENPEQPVVGDTFICKPDRTPTYCAEELKKHVEKAEFEGTAFNTGTARLYDQLYHKITEGTAMTVTPEMATDVIKVIAEVHAQNPLPLKFI